MKTHNHLFEEITSFENLLEASRKARRGKRSQEEIAGFENHLESELLGLQRELREGTYRPGGYRTHLIYFPKKRMISAAPYRDRVVHHALCNVTMPLFERKMIPDLFSNRPGKGTHAALDRCQHYCQSYAWVLKCDLKKFFPSIDHVLLKAEIRRTVQCRLTLRLMDLILDRSNAQETVCNLYPGDDLEEAASRRVGLPIGNLTSQWFGGIFLSRFDHWIKEKWGCKGYVRYVDDFLLFSQQREPLEKWKAELPNLLARWRMRINSRKCQIYDCAKGVTYLGMRIFPRFRRLRVENAARARRRLRWWARKYLQGRATKEEVNKRWQSWKGHAGHAGASRLILTIEHELKNILGQAG